MPRHLHPDGQAEFLNQQGLGAACESCGSGKLSVTVWDHYGTAPKVARHSNPAAKKRLIHSCATPMGRLMNSQKGMLEAKRRASISGLFQGRVD